MNPKVSIIVPAYNEEKTIGYLLESLEEQIVRNFQVICVDNNSTDGTFEVIKEYQRKLSYPLYLLSEMKPGPGNARKAGGEYVLNQLGSRPSQESYLLATTDADCIVLPKWTWIIEETFRVSGCGIAGGAHTARPVVDKEIYATTGIRKYFGMVATINEFLAVNGVGKIKLSGPNSAVRLDAYKAVGGFTQPLNSDGSVGVKELTDFGTRVIGAGYTVSFISCPVVSSRRRHLEELMRGCDMYFCDKSDKGKRFISVRGWERQLLSLAIKTVSLSRWREYQDFLIDKVVVYNMVIKPAINGELNLNGLGKVGLSDTEIGMFGNVLRSVDKDRSGFNEVHQGMPVLFSSIRNAVRSII